MSEQVRQTKSKSEAKRVAELEKAEATSNAEAEALKAETDDLLDEIDSVLEEDAQAFIAGYIQKGGE